MPTLPVGKRLLLLKIQPYKPFGYIDVRNISGATTAVDAATPRTEVTNNELSPDTHSRFD